MDRDRVIEIFNELLEGKRRDVAFSTGYPIFEEIYELFKEDLERKDNDPITVVYRKNETKNYKDKEQVNNRKEQISYR